MSCTQAWDEAKRLGDLVLKLHDGQELQTWRCFLVLASPVFEDALHSGWSEGTTNLKRRREAELAPGVAAALEDAGEERAGHASSSSSRNSLSSLTVEGDLEGWTEVMQFFSSPARTGEPSLLSPSSAYKILPIAHTYNMAGLLASCVKCVQQSKLPLGPLGSQPPLPPGERASQPPDLFQWLALSDARQCTPLAHACLEQLSQQQVLPVLRSALSCRQSRSHLGQLCSGTVMELLNVMTELPLGFKGIWLPDLQSQPSFHKEVLGSTKYQEASSCLKGQLLLLPHRGTYCIEVLNTQDGTSALLEGHTDQIWAVDACDSGSQQLALSGSLDGTVRLWDLDSRQCRLRIAGSEGSEEMVWSACFCGQDRAASGEQGCCIKVWDLTTGAQVPSNLTGHTDAVYELHSSPDGRLLLSASQDKTVRLWDLRTGCVGRCMTGHSGAVCSVAMDAQGKRAMSGSLDKNVMTWDLGSGRCMATLQGHEEKIHTVLMDAAGTTGMSLQWMSDSNARAAIRTWDLSRDTLTGSHGRAGSRAWSMCCSSDLSQVAVVSRRNGGDQAFDVRSWSAP